MKLLSLCLTVGAFWQWLISFQDTLYYPKHQNWQTWERHFLQKESKKFYSANNRQGIFLILKETLFDSLFKKPNWNNSSVTWLWETLSVNVKVSNDRIRPSIWSCIDFLFLFTILLCDMWAIYRYHNRRLRMNHCAYNLKSMSPSDYAFSPISHPDVGF